MTTKKKKNVNSTFVRRVIAYMLDMIIVISLSTIISSPFTITNNIEALEEELATVIEDYSSQKIDMKTYINRVSDIQYDISRQTGVSTIIKIAISILYFIVLQFYLKGQTLGKKIVNIKLTDMNGDVPSINIIAVRSLLINSILLNFIFLIFTIFVNKNTYFFGTMFFDVVQYIFLFVTAIMILFHKDKLGLHDMLCKTKVIEI